MEHNSRCCSLQRDLTWLVVLLLIVGRVGFGPAAAAQVIPKAPGSTPNAKKDDKAGSKRKEPAGGKGAAGAAKKGKSGVGGGKAKGK